MARKADLGESRDNTSRRATIHNPATHISQEDNSHGDELATTTTTTTTSQLQQYINQNKVLARRNGILSARITELEDKITSMNDELIRLRKNDALNLALELVEKNLVNSFNVSKKLLHRIRIDNGIDVGIPQPAGAYTSNKIEERKKGHEAKPLLTRRESMQSISKAKSILTPLDTATRDEPTTKKFEIPHFFKKNDQFESSSKFLSILDELDSEEMFDIRLVGVFAKEPTINSDDEQKDGGGDEGPLSPVIVENPSRERKDKDDEESNFLAEFGRHESSFVEMKEKQENCKERNIESRQMKEKLTSILPDMLEYEAVLESLKCDGEIKEKQQDVAITDDGAEGSGHDDKSKGSEGHNTNSKHKICHKEVGEAAPQQKPVNVIELDNDTSPRRPTRLRKKPTSQVRTPGSITKQRRLKRIQIKEDSPAVETEHEPQPNTHEKKTIPVAIEREVIELDLSPTKSTESNDHASNATTKSGKRKPLSNLTNKINNKPAKKRKHSLNTDWDLDIFDLRNA